MKKYLERINSPQDLKKIPVAELPAVCDELRDFVIDIVSSNPGHLGASLGVVEMTVALHYVFDTPHDNLVWDVGHQAYPHKILTGRRDIFHTNRKWGGISGFPKISESEYDRFGTGHSSTSISAALGMAIGASMQGKKKHTIAVIGDGALTGGMAYEAINHAGASNADLLVILNDNGIAIDKSVGALTKHLVNITISKGYNKFKDAVWKLMGGNTKYGENSRNLVRQLSEAVKGSLFEQSNLFEAYNFRYFGPADGHDVIHLVKLFTDIKRIPGPKLLHLITKKGKGLSKAEKEPTTYHAPGKFDKKTGEIIPTDKEKLPPKYQDVFGHTLLELAKQNPDIVGITPAMLSGSSLKIMQKEMPERVFDVGIAEQHAVTFSAGLALEGMIPFCNIYSTFMQRAYDQLIHDVALQKLPVIFCLDRAGLVGEDGATHHGTFDLAYLRPVPNLIIAAPMNETELRNLMYTAQSEKHLPFVIRYPRGRGTTTEWKTPFEKIETGKGRRIQTGDDLAVLSIGHIGNAAQSAIRQLPEEYSIAHYDMRFLKPVDEELLKEVFQKFDKIITLENGSITGGLGDTVLDFANHLNYKGKIIKLGIPDKFIEHGSVEELQKACGIDPDSIAGTIKTLLKS